MTISDIESKLPLAPVAEDAEPAETVEEKLTRQVEAVFDLAGHSALYARFMGKDGRENLALIGAAKDEAQKPRIEAQIVRGSYAPTETELEDSVLQVSGLALVDTPEAPLVPLYREVNGAGPLDWVDVNTWVVCVPLGNTSSHDFKLRASLPRPEAVPHEDAAELRLVLGAFADRFGKKQ